jgi:hypothetical protein
MDFPKPIFGAGPKKIAHLNAAGDVFVDYKGDLL